MSASNQRISFLSNLGKSLLLALAFMSLIRFLFYWNFSEKFSAATFNDLMLSFFVGIRFDLLILGFLLIPVVLLAPVVRFAPGRRQKLLKILSYYLCISWTLIVCLSFADLIYFSLAGQRMSLMALEIPGGKEVLLSGWSRLGAGTFLMNAAIFVCLWLIGNRQFTTGLDLKFQAETSRGLFWGKWALCFIFVALAARGTVSAHHLEWRDAQVSSSPVVWELSINSPWAWDKNPNRN